MWPNNVWDSHSTQLLGPIGRFSGELLKLKIYFQPGVWSMKGQLEITRTMGGSTKDIHDKVLRVNKNSTAILQLTLVNKILD